MDEHVALAKANLVRAKAQYEAAKQLYKSALEMQVADRKIRAQVEASLDDHSETEFPNDGTVLNLASMADDEGDVDKSTAEFCDDCQTSILIKCFTENTWPGSKRLLLRDLPEVEKKRDVCALCRFLAETLKLFPASPSSLNTLPMRDLVPNNQIRVVQGTSKFSWPRIAGFALGVPVAPFAWLELGSNPRIGFEGAPYVCITMDPAMSAQMNETHTEVPCPRFRDLHEQTTGLVDYNMIKSWIDMCTTCHGSECGIVRHTVNEAPPSISIYLINLTTREVVAARPGMRYLAVSYVWGDSVSRPMDKSVAQSHEDGGRPPVPNAEVKRCLPKRLPQTLEDALTLAEAIGEQFVWIDRYCIDQGNPAEVEEQVSIMDQIFRQAWLTVIAMASDSIDSGIQGVSQPMQHRTQPVLTLPQGRLIGTHVEATREHAGKFPWDQRAWTLQEFVLSRRCLIFSGHHVSMKCQGGFFHDMIPTSTPGNWSQTKLDEENWWENVFAVNLEGNEWDFKDFEGLISIYSGRQLRYQSDILRACRGTLNQIARNTGMEFTFGMPVKDLHRALLWKAHNEVCLRRRRWYDNDCRSWMSFPSWTWAGWQGRTECDYWIGDMAGYVDQDVNDEIKILNRRGRKRPRTDHPPLEGWLDSHRAHIEPCSRTDDLAKPYLRVSSSVATCKIHCVRKDNVRYQIYRNGAKRESTSISDHWTLLEPGTDQKMRDIAGEDISERLEENSCEAELLMISYWPLIRDSEMSNTWLQDMVSCLVILRNEDQTAYRVAAILLEEETWKQFSPIPAEVNIG